MKQFSFPRFCYTSNRRGEQKKWTSFHTILVLSFVKHSFILKRKVLMRNNLLISKHFLTMSIERGACSKNHWKNFVKISTLEKYFFSLKKKHEIVYTKETLSYQAHIIIIFVNGAEKGGREEKEIALRKYARKSLLIQRYRCIVSTKL